MASRTKKTTSSTNTSKLVLSVRSPKTQRIIGYLNVLDEKAAEMLSANPQLVLNAQFEVWTKADSSDESPF